MIAAISGGAVPTDLVAWRGARSSLDAFGVGADGLPAMIGTEVVLAGFMSISIAEDVVRSEFLAPPGEGGAVLLELIIAAGGPAAWLPLGGWSGQAAECELLLLPGSPPSS